MWEDLTIATVAGVKHWEESIDSSDQGLDEEEAMHDNSTDEMHAIAKQQYRPVHKIHTRLVRIELHVRSAGTNALIVRDLRDFWFKFFQKHQIWLICPLWYTV